MKLDQFTAKVSAAISAQREALTAISTKRSAAQTTLAAFISAPSAKTLPDALHARHDLDALERIMADIPDAERSEADLRNKLTALHADELADELAASITTRSHWPSPSSCHSGLMRTRSPTLKYSNDFSLSMLREDSPK